MMDDHSAQSNNPMPSSTPNASFSVDEYVPPQTATQPMPEPSVSENPGIATTPSTPTITQGLEEQNIFFLLGVLEATEEEKESFLDELQQVIWEDFIANDVELLVTEEEMSSLKQIMDKSDLTPDQKQEEMVVFLEKLIPDLEEIMLEKAIELKEDMVRERIAGMREYFAGKNEQLTKLDTAADLLEKEQWYDAAVMLNAISE